MNVRDVILNQEHIRLVAVVLNRRGGDQHYVFQRLQQQAGIHELVGKERVVFIVKDGAQFQGSGRGIDLVVSRFQLSGGDIGQVGAVQSVDRERLALAHLLLLIGLRCLPEW